MGHCTAALVFAHGSVLHTVRCSLVEHDGEHQTVGATALYLLPGEPEARAYRFRQQMAAYVVCWSDPDQEATDR